MSIYSLSHKLIYLPKKYIPLSLIYRLCMHVERGFGLCKETIYCSLEITEIVKFHKGFVSTTYQISFFLLNICFSGE